MSQVLGIVYRAITTYITQQAGYTKVSSNTGAVTFIQRFGGAVNLNVHFHMLFLDGVFAPNSQHVFMGVQYENGVRYKFTKLNN